MMRRLPSMELADGLLKMVRNENQNTGIMLLQPYACVFCVT